MTVHILGLWLNPLKKKTLGIKLKADKCGTAHIWSKPSLNKMQQQTAYIQSGYGEKVSRACSLSFRGVGPSERKRVRLLSKSKVDIICRRLKRRLTESLGRSSPLSTESENTLICSLLHLFKQINKDGRPLLSYFAAGAKWPDVASVFFFVFLLCDAYRGVIECNRISQRSKGRRRTSDPTILDDPFQHYIALRKLDE